MSVLILTKYLLLCYNLFGDIVKRSILIIILSGVLLVFSGFVFFTKIIIQI